MQQRQTDVTNALERPVEKERGDHSWLGRTQRRDVPSFMQQNCLFLRSDDHISHIRSYVRVPPCCFVSDSCYYLAPIEASSFSMI